MSGMSPMLFRRVGTITAKQCVRCFALPATAGRNHYKVLVAGGGTGGCAVAARMKNIVKPSDLAIIEPQDTHYYQAAWTLVGAGLMDLNSTRIPMQKAIPDNAEWIKDSITSFDPLNNKVTLKDGRQITYDYLVISLGFTLRYDMIKGATEALAQDPRVVSNYSADYVQKTFKAFNDFKKGPALFTLPTNPIKCAGAPQKVMYLFEDFLSERGRRSDAEIRYFTGTKAIFSAPKYAKALTGICKQRGIEVNLDTHLVEVDHKNSVAVMENLTTKERKKYEYAFLHITPPMTSPNVLGKTPDLTDPARNNFVAIDNATLRHIKFDNIFALGDCSTLPTSKTAAAIASQCRVLSDNLADVMKNGSGKVKSYGGYTSCPLITGKNKGILAEFDYELKPLETLPIDQSKERAIFAWVKKSVLPPLYWKGLITGLWDGPSKMRKLFRLGLSK